MWNSRRGYQVIDDDYDVEDPRFQSNAPSTSTTFAQGGGGRNALFGRNAEGTPLMSSSSSYRMPDAQTVNRDETIVRPPTMATSSRSEERQWDHIENLDQFFTRVYEYHQGNGFQCIAMRETFKLLQFIFIVIFSTFFLQCVDYDVLFANKNTTTSGEPIYGKRHFSDAVVENCASQLNVFVVLSILIAVVFWISRVIRTVTYLLQLHEIRLFYVSALEINDSMLSNLAWHSVVRKICLVQPRLQLMINTETLTADHIYNRILRFKNYFVALVNQRILPPVCDVPFLGEVAYMPNGLKQNLKRLLFYSSTSFWSGPLLKQDFKDGENLEYLARQLEKNVAILGIRDLVLCPLIFIYRMLYAFFTITELFYRKSGELSMRRYSNYGRYRVRHFNELDHELDARLNRSHAFANAYLNQFFSPATEIIARNLGFIAAAILAVLIPLTAWDEDVVQIQHVLTVITVCGVLVAACKGLIPDENLVWQPEVLLTHVAGELHYIPLEWKGKAHTDQVRREFEELFQLKWMYFLHELTSPIFTPFILLFWVRPRCLQIVRFFHDNTASIAGLGDICSFAQMDVAKHGDPKWNTMKTGEEVGETQNAADVVLPMEEQALALAARDGKTEMSVLHFATVNPEWKPPVASERFIKRFRDRITTEAAALERSSLNHRNALLSSVVGLNPACQPITLSGKYLPILGEGLRRLDGPVDHQGLLASLHHSHPQVADSLTQSLRQNGMDCNSAGAEMRLQSLFLRDLHDEASRAQSSANERVYGTSVAPHIAASIFGAPQLSHIDVGESTIDPQFGLRSRVVMKPTVETHTEIDETENDVEEDDGGSEVDENAEEAVDDDDGPPMDFRA